MRLKYLLPLFAAVALALMTSCKEEPAVTLLDEIQVSSSYVAIPVEGGATTITVTAKTDWTVEKVTTDKNKVEWLTISATEGSAGKTDITFTAPTAIDGRTAEVLIHNKEKTITQRINIIQGVPKVSVAKVADVMVAPDGKIFRVTGVCTRIANTTYGNWYITDDTGSLYVYGTLDKDGKSKNFLSLEIEVGDEVTIEGPKSTYNGNPQMVNVMVVGINKSLVKVDSLKNAALPMEGGELTAYLTCKGQGVSVDVPQDAKSWLAISSIQSAGTNTVVKFTAAPNTGGDRGTTITFTTTDGTKNYSTQASLTQKGAIVKATVAEFLAAAVGDTQYRLTGVISKVVDAAKGNLNIADFSGEVYAYRVADFQAKGLKVGDIVTIVGKRAAYNGAPQIGSGVVESFSAVTKATVAEVLAKPDANNVYYMVTGKIAEIANPTYGNLYLEDGGSRIYVYGCYPGYGATGDARKNLIATKGLKVGDTLTVIAPKATYNGTAQLANSFYFGHVSAP